MSEPHHHAVIRIDHLESRVFHFDSTDAQRLVLNPAAVETVDHPTGPQLVALKATDRMQP